MDFLSLSLSASHLPDGGVESRMYFGIMRDDLLVHPAFLWPAVGMAVGPWWSRVPCQLCLDVGACGCPCEQRLRPLTAR